MHLGQLTQMDPNRLQQHVFGTYVTLRYGIAVITLLFPGLVFLAGELSGVGLQGSVSQYYWAVTTEPNTARSVFVGGLFAVAVFMYLYKGFTHAENIALNSAAVLAALVALVPKHEGAWDPGIWHGTFAVSMFVFLTYVVWFRSGDTLSLLPPEVAEGSALKRYSRNWYRMRYRVIALVMLVSPVTAAILNETTAVLTANRKDNWYIFFIESAGVWGFAWYWFAKSSELKRSLATLKALHGRIAMAGGQGADVADGRPSGTKAHE
jgi:hypothetical protein